MKKHTYWVLLGLIVVLSLVGCEQNPTETKVQQDKDSRSALFEEVERVGLEYQQSMDAVLDELTVRQAEEARGIVFEKTDVEEIIHSTLNDYFGEYNDYSEFFSEDSSALLGLASEATGNFTKKQVEFFSLVDDIINNNFMTKVEKVDALELLQEKAFQEISEKGELLSILLVTELTQSSIIYWDENIVEWYVVLGGDMTRGRINWSKVGDDAAAAGVAGMMGAVAVTAVTGGTGAVAIPGAFIGGVVGGGILSVYNQWRN